MGIKNFRPDLNGVLVIDKPLGWTSAKVCSTVRWATEGAKVGHAGTLDPLATGVLVCCLGKATKSIPRRMDDEKVYIATIALDATSTTEDLEGEVTPVHVPEPPTRADIESAAAGFIGGIMQTPPIFSAVHVDGQRAYHLARKGKTPEVRAKPVIIHEITVDEYEWPRLVITVRCGKGTYIRSIARDLGKALGTGGMLTALVRTRVGEYMIENAIPAAQLDRPITPDDLLPINND